jgi:hypothetical protein
MKKSIGTLFIGFLLLISISGCGLRGGAAANATAVPAATLPPVAVATAAPSPTAIPTLDPASLTPTATIQSAADAAMDTAKKVAQDYGTALQSGDFTAASALISEFSLTAAQMTHGDAADALSAQKDKGAAWSGFQVKDAQALTEKTVLVDVAFQLSAKDAKTGQLSTTNQEEKWPIRLENGGWRYNWANLIDFKSLDVAEKLMSGVTVKPLKMSRYTDRIDLNLLVQNSTNDAVVWGSPSETISTFYFADKTIEGVNNRLIFDSLRSYPDTIVSVKGLFTSFPDKVDLRTFKNYSTAPWFTFLLSQ